MLSPFTCARTALYLAFTLNLLGDTQDNQTHRSTLLHVRQGVVSLEECCESG